MKRIKIEVTERDIEFGEPEACTRCPVAMAAVRAGLANISVEPNDDHVMVLVYKVRGEYHDVVLPHEAQVFINTFDYGNEVKPFSFEIDVVD